MSYFDSAPPIQIADYVTSPSGVAGTLRWTPPTPTPFGEAKYEGTEQADWLQENRERLAGLLRYSDDWDGYGARAPNRLAGHAAFCVLERLAEVSLQPSRLLADAIGGIALYFLRGTRPDGSSQLRARIVCANDGSVVCLCHDRRSDSLSPEPLESLENNAIDELIDRLSAFLDG